MSNVVIISGGLLRDLAVHIHVSILPKFPRIQAAITVNQSSLCYTVGACWLSTLNNSSAYHVYPQIFNYPFPAPFPSW